MSYLGDAPKHGEHCGPLGSRGHLTLIPWSRREATDLSGCCHKEAIRVASSLFHNRKKATLAFCLVGREQTDWGLGTEREKGRKEEKEGGKKKKENVQNLKPPNSGFCGFRISIIHGKVFQIPPHPLHTLLSLCRSLICLHFLLWSSEKLRGIIS